MMKASVDGAVPGKAWGQPGSSMRQEIALTTMRGCEAEANQDTDGAANKKNPSEQRQKDIPEYSDEERPYSPGKSKVFQMLLHVVGDFARTGTWRRESTRMATDKAQTGPLR